MFEQSAGLNQGESAASIAGTFDVTQQVINELKRLAGTTEPILARPARKLEALPHKIVYEEAFHPKPHAKPHTSQKLESIGISVEKKRRKIGLQHAFAAAALASIAFGIYLSATSLKINHAAQAQVNQLAAKANTTQSDDSPPSTVRPTSAAVAAYHPASDLPRYLDIPKLGVHARVFKLGLKNDGSLATPNNVFDTGWYNQSSKPGQNGAMLIDGHISSWTAHGVFYGLKRLVAGDSVSITRGDGKVFSYQVVKSQIFNADEVNMPSLLVSQDTNKPGLNLISCTGDVIPGTSEFNKRIAVYAVQTDQH